MTRDEEKLRDSANAARLIHLNDGLIFPLLRKNIELATTRLVHEFRKSGVACVNDIAYIAACQDLMTELTQIVRKGNAAANKLNDLFD